MKFCCSVKRFEKIRKYIILSTVFPVFVGGVVGALLLLTNLRAFLYNGYFGFYIGAVCFGLSATLLICAVTLYMTGKRIKRHKQYSFVEIGLKEFVISRYTGELTHFGRRYINRRLAVISFSGVQAITLVSKSGDLIISGDSTTPVRIYHDNVHRQEYSFHDGKVKFNNNWYNDTGFELSDNFSIEQSLFPTIKIYDELLKAKAVFDKIPPPAPYEHREMDFVRYKKAVKKFKKGLE
ncbi:MAG: hypothetical protein FWH05_02000 [Oscillospiraceae bacterium]|nr:hypothetical protein [Oscillospiraceae bacterium]